MKLNQATIKQFFIEKGERVGLGASCAIALLLIVRGLFWPGSGFTAGDPLQKADDLSKATKFVQDNCRTAKAKESDLPPKDSSKDLIDLDRSEVNGATYAIGSGYFHPATMETAKRRPPEVLLPEESLAAATWVPLDLYWITEGDDKEGPKLYVLKDASKPATTGGNKTAGLGGIPGSGLGRGFNQFGGPGMGGPPGMGGGRPGMGGRAPGSLGQPTTLDPLKTYTLEPVPLKDLGKLENVHPARELRPLRMAIITASFPYKRQIELFREAMRLRTAAEVLGERINVTDPETHVQKSFPSFRFLGVDLERREVDSNGQPASEWVTIDLAEAYKPWMFRAAKRFEPDSPQLAPVSPKGLVMPRLLQFHSPSKSNQAVRDGDKEKEDVEDHYPKLEKDLPKLAQTLEDLKPKLKEEAAIMPSDFDTGGVNPFDPNEGSEGRTNFGGPAAANPGMRNPALPNEDVGLPGAGGRTIGRPLGPMDASRGNTGVIPEYCLLRVIDVTIEPGKIYQYRLKVRMGNPNEGRSDVADPSWAKDPELPSTKWYDVPQRVAVPPELIYYAVDQKELGQNYDGTYKEVRVDPAHHAVLQIHRWLDYSNVAGMGNKPVAIGEWAIAERVIVHRGEYVDKTEHVQMPVWNTSHDNFVLPADTHGRQNKRSTIKVSFSHNLKDNLETILVDFEGGRESYKPADPDNEDKETRIPPKGVEDVSPIDILLLAPDGKLIARNSAADAQDQERIRRRNQVRQRIDAVKKSQTADKPKAGTGPFSPGGGGDGGGSGK
jgi:hypothetical protein